MTATSAKLQGKTEQQQQQQQQLQQHQQHLRALAMASLLWSRATQRIRASGATLLDGTARLLLLRGGRNDNSSICWSRTDCSEDPELQSLLSSYTSYTEAEEESATWSDCDDENDYEIDNNEDRRCCSRRSRTPSVSATETAPPATPPTRRRRVQFSTVQIQEYALTLGDHPYVDDYPLSLDWEHTEEQELPVVEYEAMMMECRNRRRRTTSTTLSEEATTPPEQRQEQQQTAAAAAEAASGGELAPLSPLERQMRLGTVLGCTQFQLFLQEFSRKQRVEMEAAAAEAALRRMQEDDCEDEEDDDHDHGDHNDNDDSSNHHEDEDNLLERQDLIMDKEDDTSLYTPDATTTITDPDYGLNHNV